MFNIIKKQIDWNGSKLTIETGRIARQANAAVLITMGETVVLCTVVGMKEPKEGMDFFPLTVHYQEKFYASGRIPGGFIKRETKPSEREVLISRLIDRPIRPLFPNGFYNEVQVICTTLSYDGMHDPDILSIIGTSAALTISEIPFDGPIAAVRVGYKDNNFVLSIAKDSDSLLDLVIAGTKDSILMIESEAKEINEDVMFRAIEFGHNAMQPLLKLIDDFADDCKKPKWSFEVTSDKPLATKLSKAFLPKIKKAYSETKKQLRYGLIAELRKEAVSLFVADDVAEKAVINTFNEICKSFVRTSILKDHSRIDGRKFDEIRKISCELDVLPRTHGSALFTRGETQALVLVTIGTPQDEQMVDDLLGNRSENLMLNYNFPPYSVGEASALRAPGRREIGHGKLALKAISAVMPSKEELPYAIRIVSEIMECNGSSSMATVCGSSLALMASGIPIKSPVAGIAMGLVKEGKDFAILSDIMGDEDHIGDMDFKVAGTKNGITALQMDTAIGGLSNEIVKLTLAQAVHGMDHIASEMAKTIEVPRSEISQYAPRIVSINVHKDKIREIIGSGGKVIRDICEKSGAKVDIDDTGKVSVSGVSTESIDIAMKMINDIITVPEIGKSYTGTVTKLAAFGAFVRFLGATEGLLHISEISNQRIEEIEDVMKEGDVVVVQVIGLEGNGKIRLSMKSLINGSFEASDSSNSDSSRPRAPRDRNSRSSGGGDRFNRSDSRGSSNKSERSERTGFGGENRSGGERSSGFGNERRSSGRSERSERSGFGGESRSGGERSSGFGNERRSGGRSERSERSGGNRSEGRQSSDRPRSSDGERKKRFF